MSEIENNNSFVPVPNEEQIAPSDTNESAQTEKLEEQIQYVQTVVEKYEKKTAGFWIRFCAFVLDWFVVVSIVGILINPIFYLKDWSFDKTTWYAPMSIISAVFYYGYFIITTKIWQQTLGKMIFGLKVIPKDGEKLTWGTVIFRELVGRFISNTISILYLMAAFMPKNQSLHDIFADTFVIHEKLYIKTNETITKEITNDFNSDNSATQTI